MGSPTLASALLTQQQVVDLSGVWTGTFSHCKQVHNKKNPIQKKKKKSFFFFFFKLESPVVCALLHSSFPIDIHQI